MTDSNLEVLTMARSIIEKFRKFDREVLEAFVPWHVRTWERPGR